MDKEMSCKEIIEMMKGAIEAYDHQGKTSHFDDSLYTLCNLIKLLAIKVKRLEEKIE